jgi:hypothetical protein
MAANTNQTLPVGTAVGGQCVIERHLRNGVMTEVYRARREGSGRERFEVRRFTLVASSDALRAVRRELDRIQAMQLAAVPALVDVIDDPVGLLVVTATALEGATSLRMTLDAAGSLEPAECVRIVRVIAGVLDVLHGASPQVLHRRLSPDTVTLVGASREVRVEECGLAQALVDAGLVNPRVALQARQYLSPDELLQRPSPRGDIFALASIAFECFTGRPAFLGATEASLSAAILRGTRPSVHAIRSDVPPAVDAALARAWSADASKAFLSAAALADALSMALGVPADRPRPAPGAELIGGSPPAGTPVLSAAELNLMKSTILGVGAPSRPPPTAPRAKPTEVERQAVLAPSAPAAPRARLVGGRPQMPTQRVEVPRIHPPGTERVADEAERPTFPPARLPPAAPPLKAAPSDRPAADLFNIADIDAFDIPMSPERYPSSGPPPPPARASSVPPPIPRVPSRSPTMVRSSVPPPVIVQPEPESPSSEVTFDVDVEIPASVVDDADSWEPAPRPPSMPALPRVSAPPPDESSAVDEIDPEPIVDAAAERPVREVDADEPVLSSESEPDPEPSMPVIAIPSEAAPAWVPGPAPQVMASPEPPAFAPAPTFAEPAPIPLPVDPRYAPPAYGSTPDPAPQVPSGLRKWRILGGSIVAAAAIVTGGQIYLAKSARVSEPRREVPAVLVPAPVAPSPTLPAAIADASAPLAADVRTAADDVVAVADAAALAPVTADAGASDGGAADVPARPSLEIDASAPAPAVSWDVAVFGASNDTQRDHPRRRDMGHLEGVLEPEVRRCVGQASSRHVRMTVVYEGSTGQPRSMRIVGSYAQPPAGPCLEALMRAHPVPPFRDSEFESNFVFNTNDDEE